MAIFTLIGAARILVPIVLFEGLAAIMEAVAGDPEADVQAALQRLAANNQRRAIALEATEVGAAEDLDRKFARFNELPGRALSQVSLSRQGGQFNSPRNTDLMDFLTARLGVPGHELEKMSSPSRVGDMSSIHRAVGKSFPQAPPPASGQSPQGQ